ncbi:UNVERIFIED_CONTAM: Pentatricopeptide repeat-containing protein [Sesamum indicum]
MKKNSKNFEEATTGELAEEEEERFASLIRKCPNMRVLNQIHSHPPLPPSMLLFALSKFLCFAAYRNIQYAKAVLSQIPYPSIFSYNTVMRGVLLQNPSPEPIFLFRRLVQKKFSISNTFTLAFMLKCCSLLPAFEDGKQVHKHVIGSGLGDNLKVFDEMTEKNVVAWSAMIGGIRKEMQKGGVNPDEVTMMSVISACAMTAALDLGKWLQKYINKRGIKYDLQVNTALEVFEAMPVKDAKAWSSMIIGFAIHGLTKEALETFANMEEAKVEPNHVTLISVLSACAHGGLVAKGKKNWSSMPKSRIEPSMEHYGCMVDLLCRANQTEEAYEFVKNMPTTPSPTIWRTLLVSCKKNKMLEKGEIVAEQLL